MLAGCRGASPAVDQVCVRSQCYTVEVVDQGETRRRGLQFREQLDADKGMLFIFEESQPHSFWMKDTRIPLDIIWMDYGHRVVHVESPVPPCTQDPCPVYSPQSDTLYVLELNAGEFKRAGAKEGDVLEFRLRKYLLP